MAHEFNIVKVMRKGKKKSNFNYKMMSSELIRNLELKLWIIYNRQFCESINSVFISSQKTNQVLRNARKKIEKKTENITLLYKFIIYLHLELYGQIQLPHLSFNSVSSPNNSLDWNKAT